MPAITFTGLASGLDTAAWVEALVGVKKEAVTTLENKQTELNTSASALSTVQSSFTSLRSSLEKITDSVYGGSFDLFSKTKASSSSDGTVTASSTSTAKMGSYDISVKQLASATTASSTQGALSVKGDTLLSSISDTSSGSFSVYVNGEKNTVSVDESSTIDDVLSQINNIDGVNASLKDGKISITASDGNSVVVGSSTDSINISKAFSLQKGADGNYESFKNLSTVTSSSKIADALGASALGTFTLGGAEFTIDENTTFDSLVKTINENNDAGVTASFDGTKGQLVFTSSNNGSFNINMEKGTSDFTDLMGFTSTDSVTGTTKLADQNLGQFAIFSIDGETRLASSNTITSDISGIEGVTFNLKGVSTDENPSATVSVKQDTDDLVSAVKDFIEKFNSTLDAVDTQTASDGSLYGETSLVSLRNNLRSTATARDTGASNYSILASIGITTGKTTTDVSEVSNHLEFDEAAFLKAFEEDPQSVKELLIGGKNNTGVLTKLENTVDGSLKSTGYFTTRHNSYDKQITNLTTKIETQNTRIEAYQARLEKEFKAMETLIANFQSSYSSATSLLSSS